MMNTNAREQTAHEEHSNSTTPQRPQGFTAAALRRAEFVARPHVIPGILPVGASVLAAKSGMCKTWLALSLMIALTTAGEVLGERITTPTPAHAVYIGPDESMENLQERLGILLGQEEHDEWPEGITLYDEWPRMPFGGEKLLDEMLTEDPLIRLVVMDTLEHLRKPPRGNANPYSEDVEAVQPFKRLAQKHGIALLCLHHATKSDNYSDPYAMISGTMGLMGSFDHRLILYTNEAGDKTRLLLKGKRMEERRLTVEQDPVSKAWAVTEEIDTDGTSACQQRVLEALHRIGREAKTAEIATACGMGERAVATYLGRLKGRGKVLRPGYGKYRLPDKGPVRDAERASAGATASATASGYSPIEDDGIPW